MRRRDPTEFARSSLFDSIRVRVNKEISLIQVLLTCRKIYTINSCNTYIHISRFEKFQDDKISK